MLPLIRAFAGQSVDHLSDTKTVTCHGKRGLLIGGHRGAGLLFLVFPCFVSCTMLHVRFKLLYPFQQGA